MKNFYTTQTKGILKFQVLPTGAAKCRPTN